jgi:hypothetical protein
MKTSLEFIIDEAISYAAKAFDTDQDISGADLVEWFAEWRQRAQAVVENNRRSPDAAFCVQRSLSLLVSALHALQVMGDRAEIEAPLMHELTGGGQYPPPTDAEIEELIHALDHGGIHIACGPFRATVFKHAAKGVS